MSGVNWDVTIDRIQAALICRIDESASINYTCFVTDFSEIF
jgi:hypothetical protein